MTLLLTKIIWWIYFLFVNSKDVENLWWRSCKHQRRASLCRCLRRVLQVKTLDETPTIHQGYCCMQCTCTGSHLYNWQQLFLFHGVVWCHEPTGTVHSPVLLRAKPIHHSGGWRNVENILQLWQQLVLLHGVVWRHEPTGTVNSSVLLRAKPIHHPGGWRNVETAQHCSYLWVTVIFYAFLIFSYEARRLNFGWVWRILPRWTFDLLRCRTNPSPSTSV